MTNNKYDEIDICRSRKSEVPNEHGQKVELTLVRFSK